MPDVEPSEKIKIQQFYFKNKEGIWERARQMDYGQGVKIFVHTIKTRISDIANDEQEKTLTVEEFEKFKKKCRKYRGNSRFLKKERWIYPMGELKWEIWSSLRLKYHPKTTRLRYQNMYKRSYLWM